MRPPYPATTPTRLPLRVLVLLATLTAAVPAPAQWITQSPVPTHLDVRGVGAPSAGHVFIATDDNSFDTGGALFESTDAGATWTQRDVPATLGEPLNGLFFRDALQGWAFGNANYRTTDGGITWDPLPFLGSTYFMEFFTDSLGLASGNFGTAMSRTGGLTWDTAPHGIAGLHFTDNLTGLASGDSGIHRTTDGGVSFQHTYPNPATDAVLLSLTAALAITDTFFLRSTDGGATWIPAGSALGRTSLLRISSATALAWGRSGSFPDYDDRVLRTTDGGTSWTDLGEIMPAGVRAFARTGDQNLIGADLEGNLVRSTDAGATWSATFTSPGPRPTFLSSAAPVFAGADTGYFGYGPGFVLRTTNGGASWSQISGGTGNSLNAAARFPDGRLIAAGESGTLLMRTGGSPWTLQGGFGSANLTAVQVLSQDTVLVADSEGGLYRSTDGGATWTPASGRPASLSGVADLHFTTVRNGWVIGQGFSSGALHRTTDGGESWTAVPEVMGSCVAVDADGPLVWAVNITGRYHRSTDEGASWQSADLPGFPGSISDMEFANSSTGYAAGGGGYAARSNDGGLTWSILPTPDASAFFTDIAILGPNELWISSSSGRMYYTATGGQSWSVMDAGPAGVGSYSGITVSPAGSAWTVGWSGVIRYFQGPPPPPVNRPPDAAFSFVAAGLSVAFTDSSTDPDGIIVSRRWEFGDDSTSTERNPTHLYDTSGTYIVRLTVTDDDGDSTTVGRIVVVQPQPGGVYGDFTEVTPIDSLFVTPQDEDFWVIATAPADYDSDGDLDIAVMGYYVVYNQSVEDRLILLRNDGPAGQTGWNFTHLAVPLGSLTTGSTDLAWGDADGDGDQDLVVGSDGETVLYRNDAGALTPTSTVLPAYWEENSQADFDLRSISWADYDNDGDQDLLIPSVFDDSANAYRTVLLRNEGPNGSGGRTFTDVQAPIAPTSHAQSAWADFDGDQDLDLLLVNIAPLTDNGFIRRYRNDGNGVFAGEDLLGSLTVEHGEAQWGDVDADGDLDILLAGHLKEQDGSFTQALRLYRNNGAGYDSIEVIPCLSCEEWLELTAATWADYDTDGDVDILLAGTWNSGSQIEGRAKVYINTGGVYADSGNVLPAPRASGIRGGTFSWFDIDGEGDLDYFIAGQYFVPGGNGLVEAQMHLYRNDAPGLNVPPSAPSGPGAAVQGNGDVVLTWTPAQDDHTPEAALTYDLMLYRNGVPVTLQRRIPEPGHVAGSAGATWSLTGLQDGRYYWTVRAVDAAYAGGPAVSGEFTVGATGVEPGDTPLEFALEGNYPNPFNPATTIRFSIPARSHVRLEVFSMEGRLVGRLADEILPAGVHEIRWDAVGVASGAYMVRLVTPGFTGTRKILLVR